VDDRTQSLTFTAADWNVPRTVRATAYEDDNATGETGTIAFTALGGDYEGVAGSVSLTVADDDVKALVLSADAVAAVEGGTATWTVALGTRPTGNVTVTLSGAGSGITVNPASLTFTTENWVTEQRVTASAAEDANTADESVTVTLTAAGGGYNGVTGSIVAGAADNDTPALTVPQQVTVAEGGTASWQVRLSQAPTAEVTVTLSSPGSGITTVPAEIRFAAVADPERDVFRWDAARTVTASAAQDDNAVDESVTVTHAASGVFSHAAWDFAPQ